MAVEIPPLTESQFRLRLEAVAGAVAPEVLERLYVHFLELRRWGARLSLIGPGTVAEIVERHYAESLAATPYLREQGSLLDVGSGAGFPGLVLAAALPGLAVTLVESRQRKAAFLAAAARRSGVDCTCLPLRVDDPLPVGLPDEVNCITLRAVKLKRPVWLRLLERLTRCGRVMVWGELESKLPGLVEVARIQLPRSRQRYLTVLQYEE